MKILKETVAKNWYSDNLVYTIISDGLDDYLSDVINEINGIINSNLKDPKGNKWYEDMLQKYNQILDDSRIHTKRIMAWLPKFYANNYDEDVDELYNTNELYDALQDDITEIITEYLDTL